MQDILPNTISDHECVCPPPLTTTTQTYTRPACCLPLGALLTIGILCNYPNPNPELTQDMHWH